MTSSDKNGRETTVRRKSAVRENIEAIVLAIVLALFIRTFVVQAFKIPSGSMEPTLLIGDHILVNKFIYGIRLPFTNSVLIPVKEPERGDIIVFRFPEDPKKDFIKRVIAVGGDTLEIRERNIYVNDEKIDDPFGVYSDQSDLLQAGRIRDRTGPIRIPSHSYFVMGDNRDHSYDSRFWGFVDSSALRGKALIIYFSWNRNHFSVRWSRIGHILH
ncbi:signal peptidase I [Thermodesulfobacteriota bacterium]